METRNDFRLSFMSNRSEPMTLNIPHADTNATGIDVADAMAAIINSNVVQSARGEPLFLQSAELIKADRRDFNIFA